MAICQGHRKWQQQCHSQPDHEEMNAPSIYSHEREDTCDDSNVADSSVNGFNVIPMASRSIATSFSDVVPTSVSSARLPLPFGPGHGFINETDYACLISYWTGNCNAELGRLQNVRDHSRTATTKPNARIGDGGHDGAVHHMRNTERYGNAQLDPAIVGHDPWEGLEHANNGSVATTFAI